MTKQNLYTATSAIISNCKHYRYELTREWALPPRIRKTDPAPKPKTTLFIMLNPSTADATEDDPTIRRCVSFAKMNGSNRLVVANLFAYRTSSREELRAVRYDKDIIGPEYWDQLAKTLRKADAIILGWGLDGKLLAQDGVVLEYVWETKPWTHCLTINSDGTPKHPLYIRGAAKLIPYTRDHLKGSQSK